jgi:hypothetical protein
MSTRRVASVGSALVVAAIAFLASYAHMRGLALRYGQPPLIAWLLPVSVDGMLVVATIALGDGRRHRWSAWVAFWTGVAASVVANVLAAEPSAIARCISAWPAVAFLLVVEVITRGGRLSRSANLAERSESASVAEDTKINSVDLGVGTTDTPAADLPNQRAQICAPAATSVPEQGPNLPLSPRSKPRSSGRPSGAEKVAKVAAKMPTPDPVKIAAKTGLSQRTVRRHLAALPADTSPDKTPDTGSANLPTPNATPVNGAPVPDLITASQGGTL